MSKYEVRVNTHPTIHDCCMQYYWQIVMINKDGIFTIKSGWNKHLSDAMLNAAQSASMLQIGW